MTEINPFSCKTKDLESSLQSPAVEVPRQKQVRGSKLVQVHGKQEAQRVTWATMKICPCRRSLKLSHPTPVLRKVSKH